MGLGIFGFVYERNDWPCYFKNKPIQCEQAKFKMNYSIFPLLSLVGLAAPSLCAPPTSYSDDSRRIELERFGSFDSEADFGPAEITFARKDKLDPIRSMLLSGIYLKPKKTYRVLCELANSVGSSNTALDIDADELRSLVEAFSNTSKCTSSDQFARIEGLRIKYAKNPNISRYLAHCHRIHQQNCKRVFMRDLRHTYRELDYETKDTISYMSKIVKGLDSRGLSAYLRTVNLLVHYLGMRTQLMEIGRETDIKAWESSVEKSLNQLRQACEIHASKFANLISVIDRMPTSERPHLSETEQSWLDTASTCQAMRYIDPEDVEHAFKNYLNYSREIDWTVRKYALWRANQRDFFNNRSTELFAPDEILNRLRDMINLATGDELELKSYIVDIGQMLQLEQVSHLSEGRCKNGYIDEIDMLKEKTFGIPLNIPSYLNYYHDKQLKLCKDKFETFVKDSIENLTDSEIANLDQIRSLFLVDNESMTLYKLTKLTYPAIVDFDSVVSKYLSSGQVDSERKRLEQTCQKVSSSMHFLLDLYDRFQPEDRASLRQIPQIELWLANARICEQISLYFLIFH